MSRITQLQKIEAAFFRSRTDLARALDKGPSQVSQWFSGVRPIGPGIAREIEILFGLPQGWLDTDAPIPAEMLAMGWIHPANDVPVFSRPPSSQTLSAPHESNIAGDLDVGRPRPIPVAGAIRGREDGYYDDVEFPAVQGGAFVTYWTNDPTAYALQVRGDSMHPRYRHGEFVVATPSLEAQPGGDVVVKLTNGKKLLKQLNRWADGAVQLLSINNGFVPMTVDLDQIELIHRIGGSVPSDALLPS